MKKILITIIMLIMMVNIVSAKDYYIDAKSVLLSTVIPLKENGTATDNYRAIFDLNYAQKLNDIGIFGGENNTWWKYDYRIWMSVAPRLPQGAVYWEIQPSTPCSYNPYATCPDFNMEQALDTDYIDENNVNFIALPYVLSSCTFDCNYEGDPSICEEDDGGVEGYDEFIIDYHKYYKWNCIEGETPYKCENYAISDVLDTWPYESEELKPIGSEDYVKDGGTTEMLIKLDTQIREDKVFQCPTGTNPEKIRWSCTLRPDFRSRRTSITDAPYDSDINPTGWTFDDVFKSFTPVGETNQDIKWSQCFKVNESDVSYDAYNVTIEQAMSSTGIQYTGGQKLTLTELDKVVLSKQKLINNKKQDLINKNTAQIQIIGFADIIANVFILIWYIITASLLIGMFFVQIPKFFSKLIDVFKEFTRIKKY